MNKDVKSIKKQISSIEKEMGMVGFWTDKIQAREKVNKLNNLKNELEGVGKYDGGGAVMTIFSGAGGDDAEDFSAMLYRMYSKFFKKKGWEVFLIHKNENDHKGYRNITLEIKGKNVYGTIKNESGVHRLVRISPFNSKSQRHTSFSMVEVIPRFKKIGEIDIPDTELEVSFARSSGPGGQNVNKRETAVRVVHIPTKIAVHVESERSQEQNREKAIGMLEARLYKKMEDDKKKKEVGMYVSKSTDIEWGNQVRSYVLHPYKIIKDHRTGVETRDVDSILEDGEIDAFVEAEKQL